ncbi:MAG: hypothetical protein V3V99_03585 [candidate division Zixibacteria bacterium]
MNNATSSGIINNLKTAIGFIGAITSACYIFGFIIINSFFISFGVVTYNALNTKYLAVGICFMFYNTLVALVYIGLFGNKGPFQTYRNTKESSWFKRHFIRLFWLLMYFLVFVCIMLFVFYVTDSDMEIFKYKFLYVLMFLGSLGFSIIIDLYKRTVESKLIPIVVIVVTLVLSAVFYGRFIFQYVSESVGGGNPRDIVLVFNNENTAQTKNVLGLCDTCFVSNPMKLLGETAEEYIINYMKPVLRFCDDSGYSYNFIKIDSINQAMQIKKKYVESILYRVIDYDEACLQERQEIKGFSLPSMSKLRKKK